MDPKKRTSGESRREPLPDPDRLPDDMDMDDIDGEVSADGGGPPPAPEEDACSIQRPPADS
jgi:hypothetical protein